MTINNVSLKRRFALVGILNTALDFGIFSALVVIGTTAIGANYVSTLTALIFSYAANRKYTFRSTDVNLKKQITLFFIVTLIGLWILQPLTILAIQNTLEEVGFAEWIVLGSAKIAATVVSLVWNYLLYSRLVFIERIK